MKGRGRNIIHQLPDRNQPEEHTHLIATDILDTLGDRHSERFYLLVARKVPESFIRKTLLELKQGRVASPARVFTSKVMAFAREAQDAARGASLSTERERLSARFKNR